MKTISHMLILDVDGVINDLRNKKANPRILSHIARELMDGIPIALNTGRSIDWVVKRGFDKIINNPKMKPFLENFLIIAEKGACWITFDKNGNLKEHIDKSITFSKKLRDDIRNIIAINIPILCFLMNLKKQLFQLR